MRYNVGIAVNSMDYDKMFNRLCKTYGIKPLSLSEEVALSENARRTRNNKIVIRDTIEHMRVMLDSMESKAQKIPELDKDEHSELVDNWAALIMEAESAVDKAWRYRG